MKVKLRPFLECRPRDWGIGFSLGIERCYSIDHEGSCWIPDVWIQLGPLVAGIGIIF